MSYLQVLASVATNLSLSLSYSMMESIVYKIISKYWHSLPLLSLSHTYSMMESIVYKVDFFNAHDQLIFEGKELNIRDIKYEKINIPFKTILNIFYHNV